MVGARQVSSILTHLLCPFIFQKSSLNPPFSLDDTVVQFGNTCYCNAVLQALYHLPAFREACLAHRRAISARKEEAMMEAVRGTCFVNVFIYFSICCFQTSRTFSAALVGVPLSVAPSPQHHVPLNPNGWPEPAYILMMHVHARDGVEQKVEVVVFAEAVAARKRSILCSTSCAYYLSRLRSTNGNPAASGREGSTTGFGRRINSSTRLNSRMHKNFW